MTESDSTVLGRTTILHQADNFLDLISALGEDALVAWDRDGGLLPVSTPWLHEGAHPGYIFGAVAKLRAGTTDIDKVEWVCFGGLVVAAWVVTLRRFLVRGMHSPQDDLRCRIHPVDPGFAFESRRLFEMRVRALLRLAGLKRGTVEALAGSRTEPDEWQHPSRSRFPKLPGPM